MFLPMLALVLFGDSIQLHGSGRELDLLWLRESPGRSTGLGHLAGSVLWPRCPAPFGVPAIFSQVSATGFHIEAQADRPIELG